MQWTNIIEEASSPQSLSGRYGIRGIPFTILIGKDGNINASGLCDSDCLRL
jgi:hypothetical protein